ncbi:hypothetical protein AEP_04105 (plasmid) [Curvibacter sp. AEP1-3]|uniref:hypothetical protein n=1 Tax=Curvibacter sp. AEP1-3 TaxID=1844971 RepID=UPI000B3D1CA6|nr:hypothetical protein [Curvibacter sp. AEP1-3]ARV21019.1 hypothetical protein AEP_04105 [Curvibacter sp. AEP1-3]
MDSAATKKKGAPNGHSALLSQFMRVATAPLSGCMASTNDNACQAKTLDKKEATAGAAIAQGFPVMVTGAGDVVVMTPDDLTRLARMLRGQLPKEAAP